jgi:thioredoxin 1
MAEVIDLDDQSFDQEIAGADRAILVDFWASWCGSCRLMMPSVLQLSDELSDALRVAKVDVEPQAELAERLAVKSVPTLIMYRAGEEVMRVSGVKSKSELMRLVKEHL